MGKICFLGAFGVTGALLLVFGILVATYFDPLIDDYINNELVIRNGTSTYELWVEPPVVPYISFYFFNVTNAAAFLLGEEKPHLQEIGPYSYREKWERVNVSFNDNGTVTYQTQKFYYFDSIQSAGSEDDIVHTLDIPVAVTVDKVKYFDKNMKLIVSSLLQALNKTSFIEKTVHEIIWGYEDKLINISNRFLPPEERVPYDKFGLFYKKNGSADAIFNVYTGANDIKKYTLIDTVNREKMLPHWKTPKCNMLNGTDGTSFPPNVTMDSKLYLFNTELCRSLPLEFNQSVELYGIETLRFTPPIDVFANNSENQCFCKDSPCLGDGLFNISVCQYNAPIVLSMPHFLFADDKYLNSVEGLNPQPGRHETYFNVIPKTGVPLGAQARMQINIATHNEPKIKAARNMAAMIFPVVWFEEGVVDLSGKLVSRMQQATNLPIVLKSSLLMLFFILGAVSIFIAVATYIYLKRRKSSKFNVPPSQMFGHTNPTMSSQYPDN